MQKQCISFWSLFFLDFKPPKSLDAQKTVRQPLFIFSLWFQTMLKSLFLWFPWVFGVKNLELRRSLLEVVFPAFIVFVLWLDGWFYPLLLLPFLYVKLVDKKGLKWIGFHRENLSPSVLLGVCSSLGIIVVWYLFFVYYLPPLESVSVTPYILFTDVFWYPFYEEVTYRGFALAYFVPLKTNLFSSRSTTVNFTQTLLFVFIHHRYVATGVPLFLVLVFLLGLINGFIFLKTRNLFGCFLCHSIVNTLALLIPLFVWKHPWKLHVCNTPNSS